MRIPGVKTAKMLSRWVQARVLGGALILGYHRISATQEDTYEVCVSPENFEEHLAVLRKYTHTIGLSKLVQHLKEGSVPQKWVAITFDDGYADNLYIAKPMLEKYEVPATVFVCTGNPGKEFWWDELERLVASSTAEFNALARQMQENGFPWTAPDADLLKRSQFRHSLYYFLLTLEVEEQNRAMQVIRDWSGVLPEERGARRSLEPSELLQLAGGGLVELGSHTRNHPMLPQLSLERQREEIITGKQELESILGRPVDGFSYPNGRATWDAKRIVQELGFAYACTSLHDTVRPGADLYELTRFWQKDVRGDKFMEALNLWMKLG